MVTQINDPTATIRSNILNDYANYTYNLQLWALDIQNGFNKIAEGIDIGNEASILRGGELLIANGGFSKNQTRSPSFGVDYAIDNLEIESVVGNRGPRSRNIDAINIKFDIIEPYSVSLIDRLMDVTLRKGMGGDYKTIIYCLVVQFYGYDNLGNPQKIDATKYFPLSILNMSFSLTKKGAVYACEAIPCQNMIMTLLDNIVPFHIEVTGQTVQDLFNGTLTTGTANASVRTDSVSTQPNNSNTVVYKGVATALKANEDFKVNQRAQTYPNIYKFEFDPMFASAKIVRPERRADQSTVSPTARGAVGQQNLIAGRFGTIQLDRDSGTYRSQAGTKITELINSVLLNSDFTINQVQDQADPSQPFKSWKIIPKLKILNYDEKTNFFTREVTYTVVPFNYYGEDHPNLGQKPVPPASIVKNYQYLYTGKNDAVLDAKLEYKMFFFEARNALKNQLAQKQDQGTGDSPPGPANPVIEDTNQDRRWNKPILFMTNGLANMQHTGDVTGDEKRMVVTEMVSKLLDNGGDMIQLDLEIVGDPDWLQQDSIVYSNKVPTDKTLRNGVINYQNSITCFQFNFKVPVNKDYDPEVGLFDLSDSETARFSGIYQVLVVHNHFRRGKFTQKLENVRVRIQSSSDTRNGQRTTTTTNPRNDGQANTTVTTNQVSTVDTTNTTPVVE